VHSAKGLEWPVVFWADLGREPVSPGKGPILIGRETLALRDPDEEVQGAEWTTLLAQEKNEAEAEQKRLWYVATTRARDRLILSGFSSAGLRAGCPATVIGQTVGLDQAGGDTLSYQDQRGNRFEAGVQRIPADEAATPAVEEVFAPADLPGSAAPIRVLAGRARHSATELMVFTRCPQRHWFKYVAGVREPALNRSGPEWGSAVARGQVVHDVLEHIREESELAELLEAAVGRWDPYSPAPDTEPGREYREALAREVGAVRTHPDYRAMDDAPGRRRELEFYHLIDADDFLQGKIDLAAPAGNGIAALDVKTGGGSAEVLERKTAGYALQQSVYVGALEAVGGVPVNSFAFHFAGNGVQVGGAVTDDMRAAGKAEVLRVLREMDAEAPALTSYPAECRWCGYRREGWCSGVQQAP
jgi:ATP-dependent exoDNAse (exonuclease V) beta subunit